MFSICRCCSKREPFEAVSDVWYHIDSENLFCLLGHNGAGKVGVDVRHSMLPKLANHAGPPSPQTTTINMLIGQVRPTCGDAEVYGYSILNQMDKIREFMGVCPQFV